MIYVGGCKNQLSGAQCPSAGLSVSRRNSGLNLLVPLGSDSILVTFLYKTKHFHLSYDACLLENAINRWSLLWLVFVLGELKIPLRKMEY